MTNLETMLTVTVTVMLIGAWWVVGVIALLPLRSLPTTGAEAQAVAAT